MAIAVRANVVIKRMKFFISPPQRKLVILSEGSKLKHLVLGAEAERSGAFRQWSSSRSKDAGLSIERQVFYANIQ
ncbi:MAG TPA: hypothetical protein VJW55_11210, partial [Candidatus Angelobacter sp.]|nr:hypothetical protein [Candidatus Angelobacter sp.]